jgi:methionyl-tRNA synthetase
MRRIIVTSALPYANGPIHIGHLVEYIQTDIFVRFLRLQGKDVVYCCADDTHGTPIEIKANELGKKPEELISEVYKEHLEDFKLFQIDFNSFYTTNSPENKHFSELFFNRLKDKKLIYQKEVENFFDEKAKRFLPDRYVKGECPKCHTPDQYGDVCENCNATYKPTDLVNPYSVITKATPTRKRSVHYFFKLSALSEKLERWLISNKKLQPEVVNYVRNWIKEGLKDWDISRDGPYFGFKIPGEDDKCFYVWLDAPNGYISSFANTVGDVNKAEQEWNQSQIIHFIGKDIMYFHFLFWPAMLMEAGFNLPEEMYVHGFLTVDGAKMSKSRGTFLTAKDFASKYNPEYLRFYYARVLSKKMSDIDLNFKDFVDSINNELVANLANFCNRALTFLEKNFESEIKDIEDSPIIKEIENKIETITKAYGDLNYNEALREILAISDIGNKYFQENEPWMLIKADKEKVHRILGLSINIVKNLCILIKPILPEFSKNLEKQLNLHDMSFQDLDFRLDNHRIKDISPLVEKVEIQQSKTFPLNLKVARITEVKDHPDADKLLVMQIDLGKEKRQLVAGIKEYYSKEELL